MLARLLPQPLFPERRPERRAAVVLPFSRLEIATQKTVDWSAKYPCTRMHGAAFEAELYPAADGAF